MPPELTCGIPLVYSNSWRNHHMFKSYVYMFKWFWTIFSLGAPAFTQWWFISWDFTEKKSEIFVSFPFSRRFTLSIKRGRWEIFKRCLPLVLVGSQEVCSVRIPFYANVGVAENWFLVRNDVVSFSVVLLAGVKCTKIGFINWVDKGKLATVTRF